MYALERLLVELASLFASAQAINAFFRDPRVTAIVVAGLISVAGGLLGSLLLLRRMSLTSDAISHTVLLGIALAFLAGVYLFGEAPELSNPWLIVGAAAAGVLTVVLTELLGSSGLLTGDAALGLVFSVLFAIGVILVSGPLENVHLDEDAVMVGEIGIAWANTNTHVLSGEARVTVDEDSPSAEFGRRCVNCDTEGISPRSPRAEFERYCINCGDYDAQEAWQAGLLDERPEVVFWPRSVTSMLVMSLLAMAFVVMCYKELKLSSFDAELAASLGFRPALLNYALMAIVSLVAVAAFDAVGSILVIAFFIIPAATAYLLTDRLSVMLGLSALIGTIGSVAGYELSRGSILGLVTLPGNPSTSISAAMVVAMLAIFLLVLVLSPRYGLVSRLLSLRNARLTFQEQILLGHIANHAGGPGARTELARSTLSTHVRWDEKTIGRVVGRLQQKGLVYLESGRLQLSETGAASEKAFRARMLGT